MRRPCRTRSSGFYRSPWSVLHQLDARHLGTIAFPMSSFEDARVATRTLGVPRPDLTEQLVGRFALVNMSYREPPRVQRAGLRLGDQLLDERTELLGFRLGRHDRAALDERGREIPHQCELLLA